MTCSYCTALNVVLQPFPCFSNSQYLTTVMWAGLSQCAVIQAAMLACPNQLLCQHNLEAHGTGTALGDPVEMSALRMVMAHNATLHSVSAVKSNLGHTELASGCVGAFRAIIHLQIGFVTPSLYLLVVNPMLGIDNYVALMSQAAPFRDVKRQHTLTHGVSAFGFAGTNAHVVLTDTSSRHKSNTSIALQHAVQYQLKSFAWWQPPTRVPAEESFLGSVVMKAPSTVWERIWPSAICCYAAHHCVGYTSVLPCSGYICMASVAAASMDKSLSYVPMYEAKFSQMLFLDSAARVVQVNMQFSQPHCIEEIHVAIKSTAETGVLIEHASVLVKHVPEEHTVLRAQPAVFRPCRAMQSMDSQAFYNTTGNNYQGPFRLVDALWLVCDGQNQPAIVAKLSPLTPVASYQVSTQIS